MANRRWRGFVFEQVTRPGSSDSFSEWRCVAGPADNLVLLAWPVFSGKWYATITYHSEGWFSNGMGKDFRSALNDALRNMRAKRREAEAEVKELRLTLQRAEEASGFYCSAVTVVEGGGKKEWPNGH